MVIAAALLGMAGRAVAQTPDAIAAKGETVVKCETVRTLPTFRDAYRLRRCIVPVDGFFEWRTIKGQKAKQPYAIAMKDGKPFGIAGIWENWRAADDWRLDQNVCGDHDRCQRARG
jgi:putative SOS response-associated peptidase YedK